MSVHGEFLRYLGDLIDLLEGEPNHAGSALADALSRARDRATDDLSAAAERVLAEMADAARVADDPGTLADLQDTIDRLTSISRIIVGR